MQPYATAGWDNYFIAAVGATAGLVGLLFVAVSINLNEILKNDALPGRAIDALVVLGDVLFVAILALLPGQTPRSLGLCALACGGVAWAWTLYLQLRTGRRPGEPLNWLVGRILATQLATLPMIAAGISLLVERGGGLYWTAPAMLISIFTALFDAWVLLVEIQR